MSNRASAIRRSIITARPSALQPDFNLIEKAFSKLKAMLRKIGERTVNGLWDLISSCGYDPD